MSQRHVDLLMEAVNTDIYHVTYLCNKIMIVCSDKCSISPMYDVFANPKYTMKDCAALKKVIQSNIDSNLDDDCPEIGMYTFYSTTFYVKGMSRKEWANTILAPLALALED